MNDRQQYSQLQDEQIEQNDHSEQNDNVVVSQPSDALFSPYKVKLEAIQSLCEKGDIQAASMAARSIHDEALNQNLYAQYVILQQETDRLRKLWFAQRSLSQYHAGELTLLVKLDKTYDTEKLKTDVKNDLSPITFANLGLKLEVDFWEGVNKNPSLSKACFFIALLLTDNKKGLFAQTMLEKIKNTAYYILFVNDPSRNVNQNLVNEYRDLFKVLHLNQEQKTIIDNKVHYRLQGMGIKSTKRQTHTNNNNASSNIQDDLQTVSPVQQPEETLFDVLLISINTHKPYVYASKYHSSIRQAFKTWKSTVKKYNNLYSQYALLDFERERKEVRIGTRPPKFCKLGKRYTEGALLKNLQQNFGPLTLVNLGLRYQIDSSTSHVKADQKEILTHRSQLCFFIAYLLLENKNSSFGEALKARLNCQLNIKLNRLEPKFSNGSIHYTVDVSQNFDNHVFEDFISSLNLTEQQTQAIHHKIEEIIHPKEEEKEVLKKISVDVIPQGPKEELLLAKERLKSVPKSKQDDRSAPRLQEFNHNNNTYNPTLFATPALNLSETEIEIENLATELNRWYEQARLWDQQRKLFEDQAEIAKANYKICEARINEVSDRIKTKHDQIHTIYKKEFGG